MKIRGTYSTRPIVMTMVVMLFVAGCASNAYRQPESSPYEVPGWVRDFSSPELVDLVSEAQDNSPDISVTLARLDAARARALISGADRYPAAGVGLGANRGRRTTSSTGTVNNSVIANAYELSADVSWQLDLWQRISHRHRAAIADTEASQADLDAARLLLTAQLTRSWFAAVESELQVALAEKRVSSFSETEKIIADRYRAGIDESLDLRLARENLATAQAVLFSQRQKLDANIRSLEALLGRYPNGQIGLRVGLVEQVPGPGHDIPDGLKSRLLLRRPDVRAAERRLQAGVERNMDSQRNYLPSFSMTASGGRSSDQFRNLLNADNLIWSVVASLVQPLFQGGRLKGERALALANKQEAVASYSQTVLNAFREVETALAAEPLLTEQVKGRMIAARESREAATLALSRYRAGLTEIITLLDTQRRAFNAESVLLETQLNRLTNRINLYLALGGDFDYNNPAATGKSE